MNFNQLALKFVHVTEVAAFASAKWTGRGNSTLADQAAVDAMRKAFDSVPINGVVVIGEGERDEAPMLFIGEQVGQCESGHPPVDIALDPLEGTSLCSNDEPGAISVMAITHKGHFLHAPDTYMDKIAVGPQAKDVINIEQSPTENIQAVAKSLGKSISEMMVAILDRPRHKDLITEVRQTNARIHLFGDGDVAMAMAAAQDDSDIDLLLGIGGAPEGVLAASALKCLKGNFQGQLKFRNPQERQRAMDMGLKNPDQILKLEDLVSFDVLFVATGVTDGSLLNGVRFFDDGSFQTSSLLMDSQAGTIRYIDTLHPPHKQPL